MATPRLVESNVEKSLLLSDDATKSPKALADVVEPSETLTVKLTRMARCCVRRLDRTARDRTARLVSLTIARPLMLSTETPSCGVEKTHRRCFFAVRFEKNHVLREPLERRNEARE